MSINQTRFKKHWVRLTRCCNNRCLFCHDNIEQDGSFATFSEIAEDIDLGRKTGAESVVLSGGEPTIHPDFVKIVKYARETGYEWIQTITNGRMFSYRSFVEKSLEAGLNEITFSIHAHTPGLFDEITGVKGSFSQTYRGLTNALNTKGLVVSIDIVVMKMNIRHVAKTIQTLSRLGAKEFDLMFPMPFGRAWDNREKILISKQDAAEIINSISETNVYSQTKIWTSRFPEEIFEKREFLIQAPEKISGDVFSHADYFMGFLSRGVPIPCSGERCEHCFLARFCRRLEALKIDILKNKPLAYLAARDIDSSPAALPPPETISRLICADIETYNKLSSFIIEHSLPAAIIFSGIPAPEEIPEHSGIEICILINPDTVEKLSGKNSLPEYNRAIFLDMDNRMETLDALKIGFFSKTNISEWIDSLPFPIANLPPCARRDSEYLRLDTAPAGAYVKNSGWRLELIANHFLLNERYCKPPHCGECCFDTECKGFYINLVRVFGFGLSRGPLKKLS